MTDTTPTRSRVGGRREGAGRPRVLKDRVRQLFQIERHHLQAIQAYAVGKGYGTIEDPLISEALREVLDLLMQPGALLAPPPTAELK